MGMFVATFLGVVSVVSVFYPDMPAVKAKYEGVWIGNSGARVLYG